MTSHMSARKAQYKHAMDKKGTLNEAVSFNPNSKDNFKFHIKRDI